MPYTDKTGKVWPDTMNQGGVALILDPVASLKTGRPKYRADPKQQQEYAYKYGFAERPKEPTGPLEGLAMVGGSAAALVGGQKLGESLSSIGSQTANKAAQTGLSQVGQTTLANQGGQTAGQSLASLSGSGAPAAKAGEVIGVQTLSDGSTLMSDGSVVAPGVGIAPYLGLAGAGLGAYGIKEAIDARDPKMGAISGAGMGLGLGAAAPLAGFGPLGWGALGLMALGGGALGGGLTAGLGHESTKEAQERRWGKLSPSAQLLKQANHPENDDGIWDTGKYAGQKWTFEKALDLAKEDPTHFQGVYGNLSALGDGGDKYLALNDAQQKEFVRQNIAAGNYDSKKGDVIIKDKERAQQIYQGIIGPQKAQQNLAQAGVVQPTAAEDKKQKLQGWMR